MPRTNSKAKLAIKNAEELLTLPKLRPAIKIRLIELLLKHTDEQAHLQNQREERRHQAQDRTAEIVRLKAENKALKEQLDALKAKQPQATPKRESDEDRARRLLAMPSVTPERGPRSHPYHIDSVSRKQTESATSRCSGPRPEDNPSLEQNESLKAIREANAPVPPMASCPREQALRERDAQPTVSMESNYARQPSANPRPEEEPDIRVDDLPEFDIRDVISEEDEAQTRKALIAGIDKLLG